MFPNFYYVLSKKFDQQYFRIYFEDGAELKILSDV